MLKVIGELSSEQVNIFDDPWNCHFDGKEYTQRCVADALNKVEKELITYCFCYTLEEKGRECSTCEVIKLYRKAFLHDEEKTAKEDNLDAVRGCVKW